MKFFLLYQLALYILAIFGRLMFLSSKSYPRALTYTRSEDAWSVVIYITLSAWTAYLVIGVFGGAK